MDITDLYEDPRYAEYDIQPLKTRPAGGGSAVPFHTGKGTRAKLAAAAKHTKGVAAPKAQEKGAR